VSGIQVSGRKTGWPHWTTPQWFIELVRSVRPIALDPCANQYTRWGRVNIIAEMDGFSRHWAAYCGGEDPGLVFVNPPYGREIERWVEKMATQAKVGCEILGLLPARVDAGWCHDHVFRTADAYLLWRGRIQFENGPPEGENKGSSVMNLVAYWGPNVDRFAKVFGHRGELVLR
jgi:site-specific DNA-methyltransferase (adenine-specific)